MVSTLFAMFIPIRHGPFSVLCPSLKFGLLLLAGFLVAAPPPPSITTPQVHHVGTATHAQHQIDDLHVVFQLIPPTALFLTLRGISCFSSFSFSTRPLHPRSHDSPLF